MPDSREPSAEVAHGPHEPSDKSEPNHSIWGTRLQPGQVRLFNIELDEGDEIKGTLEAFEHESAPQYIAQSYVCGEGVCDIRITVNGNAHCIKPNLFIALRQTKSALQQGKSGTHWGCPWTQTTWLWIDAISIHQSDVPELEMQIQFMEHIYRGASSTLVSLGNWAESHKLISMFCEWRRLDIIICYRDGVRRQDDSDQFQTIDAAFLEEQALLERRLQTEFNINGDDLRTITLLVWKGDQAARSTDVGTSSQAASFFHPFWQACMELTEADWFSRVWTFQELVLSRELFVTLQSCVPWGMLKPLLHCDEGFERDQPGLNHRSSDNYSAARLVRYLKFAERHHASLRYFVGGSEEYQYLHLSGIIAMRHATVPKDHVFAILGLLDAATQSLIQVDYSKTDAQVFREFLELALKTSCAAQILPRLWEAFATVPITAPDLPSWCLDFQNETDARLGIWVITRAFSEPIKRAFADAAHLRVSPEDGRIFLKVLEVDVVSTQCAGKCPEWSPGDYSGSGAIPLMVWIKCVYDDILSDSGDHPSAVEVRLESFLGMLDGCGEWRIVALHFLMAASLLPAEDFTLCKLVSHLKHGLHATHELRQEILENINTDPEHKALDTTLSRIAAVVKARFGGAYVFATKGGRLGYSPKPVSPGDRICIVPGGQLFHIFSAAPGRYITCAVVQGLMEDSLLDFVSELDRDWEGITIH